MKAAIHDRFGDPAEVLTAREATLPEPGAGQVRVRTILSPIHNHDLWTVRGSYGYKPSLPAIGGSEAVGIVDATGPDTDPALKGRRVAVAGVHETWAEAFLAPAAGLVPVPDQMPDEVAAQLIAMPFSAVALLDSLGVTEGDWIVQNAANGAVGTTLAALAKRRGVRVLSLVRRAEAVHTLAAQGTAEVLATDAPDWLDTARALIGPSGARAAVDSIGGAASGDLLSLLGEKGLLVTFGTASGEPMQLSSGDLIFKQATVRGFWAARLDLAPDTRARLMGEIFAALSDGALTLPSGGTFPLDQVAQAVTAAITPGRAGKVMLRP